MLVIEGSESQWFSNLPKLQYVFAVIDMIEFCGKKMEALFMATLSLQKWVLKEEKVKLIVSRLWTLSNIFVVVFIL